jgi:hypothetical protein
MRDSIPPAVKISNPNFKFEFDFGGAVGVASLARLEI